LEFANLLIANGERDRAQDVLKALAEDYPNDEALGRKIDRVSSEPLSEQGKAAAVKLNREGKALLQEKDFSSAVSLFGRALDLYPNNIGLKLNLVLAQIQRMKVEGRDADVTLDCRNLLDSIGELATDSEFYKLYNTLKQSL
jgi:thioredoxin-like negative regulator of GroEL